MVQRSQHGMRMAPIASTGQGLVHPVKSDGSAEETAFCGWVKDGSGGKLRDWQPFWYSDSSGVARVGEGSDWPSDQPCKKALGL